MNNTKGYKKKLILFLHFYQTISLYSSALDADSAFNTSKIASVSLVLNGVMDAPSVLLRRNTENSIFSASGLFASNACDKTLAHNFKPA